jgi:hypothetical protein
VENESGEFNISEAAEEIIAEGDSSSDSAEVSSQSEGQSEQDSQEAGENKELSAEEILRETEEGEKENPEQFADLLKMVNGLGAIHHGAPIQVDSPEKLKQLLEMGAGFYQKTEAHANEVKAKEAEFQQKETAFKEREQAIVQQEQQIQQEVYLNQIMADLLQDIKTEDPELFAHIDALFIKKERAYEAQRPLQKQFEGKFNALQDEIKTLKTQKVGEENQSIQQNWEKELSQVQTTHAAKLAKLGVKPDWKKVEETWAADATGKMTVEQAMLAVHGQDILKAHESQKKLLETKAKTNAKLLGRTGVGKGAGSRDETIEAAAVGDYGSILRQSAATM